MNRAKIEEYVLKRPNTTVAEIQFVFKLRYSEARSLVESMVNRDILAYRGGMSYENLIYNDDVWGVRADKKYDWEMRNEDNDISYDDTDGVDGKRDILSDMKILAATRILADESIQNRASKASRTTLGGKKKETRKRTEDKIENVFGYRVENGRLIVGTDRCYPDGSKFMIEKTERNDDPYFSDSGKTLKYISQKFGVSLETAQESIAESLSDWEMMCDDPRESRITVEDGVLWCKITKYSDAHAAFDIFALAIDTIAGLSVL